RTSAITEHCRPLCLCQCIHTLLDTLRRNKSRRIDTYPTLTVKPNLRPSVRILLPYFPNIAAAAQLTTLIACDDACWNASGAHHKGKARRIMLTKPRFGLK